LGFVIFLFGVILQEFSSLAFSESFYSFWRTVFALMPWALLAKGISSIAEYSDNEGEDGKQHLFSSSTLEFSPILSPFPFARQA
jgi:hypothetical protein